MAIKGDARSLDYSSCGLVIPDSPLTVGTDSSITQALGLDVDFVVVSQCA